jgi:hypothetical protein
VSACATIGKAAHASVTEATSIFLIAIDFLPDGSQNYNRGIEIPPQKTRIFNGFLWP